MHITLREKESCLLLGIKLYGARPQLLDVLFILWLISHERLYTMDKLMDRAVISSNCYYLCSREIKTLYHLFLKCDCRVLLY